MKFSKLKRFLSIISVILVGVTIVFLLNITRTNHQSMSEMEVRTQLEQMYDVEVASVKMEQDIYEALITKSGSVYEVEMDSISGEVNSLKQSDNYILKKDTDISEGPLEFIPDQSSKTEKQPILEEKSEEAKDNLKTKIVKNPTKIIISEKQPRSSTKEEGVETSKPTDNTAKKSLKSATSKAEEKVVEEKPSKEVSKETLKPETSKQEEAKTETPKEENTKTEETPEANKSESTKTDSAKTETSKTEETKTDEAQTQVSQTITIQSDTKKTEVETKPEKSTTILITEEQAIKKAQQQQKGTVENSSFVKTNEGGYYLIVMKGIVSESDSKESTKEKKTKATIQVHAISGKILSVTWE
ncbi:hypothetical protein [Bacillus sp. FJAT-22090]|uniref:hypothetical protein n=1 Tax=Bacillus sp. FJAT-22090 TaxID=1581038 RepID=UPI00119D6F9C|nr:hypothetical protein [Bacillus sp. FJAT-22090]